MVTSDEKRLELACQHARETALLESASELLQWDERTLMPKAAGEYRAEQTAFLSGLIHRRRTDERFGDWLEQLAGSDLATDPHSDAGATIGQLRRDFQKQTKLPPLLVEELTRSAVRGQQAWVEARERDDFALFQPWLEKIVQLKRQQAEALGYERCAYDALVDEFEQDMLTSEIGDVLYPLREGLVPIVQAIADSGKTAPVEILAREFPIAAQETFAKAVAARIGFDFDGGRLDVTHHPFCTTLGPSDCRITTRYDQRFFSSAFFGTLHEAGHGIYEQGLRADQYGLPLGTAVSLGMHESQSRMWENLVARSRSFWQHLLPRAADAFPGALADVSLDDFYWAVNDVRPSLIRVEADEATYNLHIIIRFELEQLLINDDLPVRELPSAWNDKYEQYLGIRPPNDADGVLQDIHWGAALIGYFPTYALGNVYAAQLFQQAESDLGPLEPMFARGQFEPLRTWLGEKVHQQGQRYPAATLIANVTGRPPSPEPLVAHLRNRLLPLYDVSL